MSDHNKRKPVIVVPVDPEAYGKAWLFSYIVENWWQLLLSILLIAGILGIGSLVTNLKSEHEKNVQATQIAIQQVANATAQARVQNEAVIFSTLRDNKQAIALELMIGDAQECGDHMIVHSLDFAEDGIRLYFDAALMNNDNNDVKSSWLMWNPNPWYSNDRFGGGIEPDSTQVSKSSQNTSCNSLKVEHFSGYLVYPYSEFDNLRNSSDGILYFAIGGYSENIYDMYPILSLDQAENWKLVPIH